MATSHSRSRTLQSSSRRHSTASSTTNSIMSSSSSSLSSSSSSSSTATRRSITTWRKTSFITAIASCLCAGSITAYSLYGHLFQTRLQYTQFEVNLVQICSLLAMYLPVSILGYICDRAGPAPLSLLSAVLLGLGYFLAAFTYRSGRDTATGLTMHRGWPVGVMVFAFTAIGTGTVAMYLSAVTTVAKNFGRGKYRGLALACPIAALGLSGMWQSQVGSRLLYERLPDGRRGDVDVFRFFIFLGSTLIVAGLAGTFLLRVVEEDALIDEAVSEMERSGVMERSGLLDDPRNSSSYGSVSANGRPPISRSTSILTLSRGEPSKKSLLLNSEIRAYLTDHTMYLMALGFFFVSGPGEAFIANLGTVIGTLSDPKDLDAGDGTSPATHVSILAIASTVARLLAGTATDILAPTPATSHPQGMSPIPPNHFDGPSPNGNGNSHYHNNENRSSTSTTPPPRRCTISRLTFLITSALLLSFGDLLLSLGYCQGHPSRFWLITLLHGLGYGAIFSLTPLIVTVIWGVENFGTNWGLIAMMPAFGNALWGSVYSAVYERARRVQGFHDGPSSAGATRTNAGDNTATLCYGRECYAPSFGAMAASVWVGCLLWFVAWRGRDGWVKRGIAV